VLSGSRASWRSRPRSLVPTSERTSATRCRKERVVINLRYVALKPITVQVMNEDGTPTLDEDGAFVFKNFVPADEVDPSWFKPSRLDAMVEYRSLLQISGEVTSYPKHHGGPWYELSNGVRVQGRANAEQAEAELQVV